MKNGRRRHPRSGVRPICSLTLVGLAQTLRDDPRAALKRSVATTCLSSLSAQVQQAATIREWCLSQKPVSFCVSLSDDGFVLCRCSDRITAIGSLGSGDYQCQALDLRGLSGTSPYEPTQPVEPFDVSSVVHCTSPQVRCGISVLMSVVLQVTEQAHQVGPPSLLARPRSRVERRNRRNKRRLLAKLFPDYQFLLQDYRNCRKPPESRCWYS
jgi:hypothetical protein